MGKMETESPPKRLARYPGKPKTSEKRNRCRGGQRRKRDRRNPHNPRKSKNDVEPTQLPNATDELSPHTQAEFVDEIGKS